MSTNPDYNKNPKMSEVLTSEEMVLQRIAGAIDSDLMHYAGTDEGEIPAERVASLRDWIREQLTELDGIENR